MRLFQPIGESSREHLAERVSAATYGTVLIVAALLVVDADDVASGWGWELVTGVGVATWVAHIYAEILGNHIRNGDQGHEVRTAMADGLPILLVAMLPAVVLALGGLGVVEPRLAVWIAIIAAVLQLVGLGAYVGVAVRNDRSSSWRYAAMTAGLGIGVILFVVALGH